MSMHPGKQARWAPGRDHLSSGPNGPGGGLENPPFPEERVVFRNYLWNERESVHAAADGAACGEDSQDDALDRLSDFAAQLHLFVSRQYAALGLTIGQARLLRAVEDEPGLPQGEYGRRLDFSEVMASQHTRHLVSAGLIEKRDHFSNGRLRLLFRTGAAPDLTGSLERVQARVVQTLLRGIPAPDQRRFVLVISRMQDAVEDWEPPPR
jgi:DNA-binding MarR family transcriptional regulator